ncbi:MAG: DUF6786 family protein, partial [Bacteroidota bacterium]
SMLLTACNSKYEKGTFGYNLQRLQPIEGIQVLESDSAMIAVSGVYQGRIFLSSAKERTGKSYGWVNWKVIEKGEHATSIAGLGGESRIWFAPEWGPFALFFPAGVEQDNETMEVPYDLNNKKFTKIRASENTLTYGGAMQLKNDVNTTFDLNVERTIQLFSKKEIEEKLQIDLSNKDIASVGFSAATTVTNIGDEQFTKAKGLIALWELGCMLTSPDTKVIIPLSQPTDSITPYFTPIGNRMMIKDSVVFYKADARGLNKIGVLPQFCTDVMGSYDPSQQLLNIVTFNFEKDSLYVNSVPKNTTPFRGDVINIFNGEVTSNFNLPFFEFESASSAKALKPLEKISHEQTTYHFEGNEEVLESIAVKVLGVSLKNIPEF